MKRSGFTMIELVFVIVILGILASVAIPKLAATRDDAKIASKASEIQAAISEIPAFVTAQGEVKAPAEMSQVLAQLVNQGKATVTTNSPITGSQGQLTLHSQNGSSTDNPVVLDVNNTTLVVTHGSTCAGVICKQLQKRIAEGNYTIGGTSLKF
jgi:prepilin-type N-terminal cleavage/methylation domain-containing protein